MPRITHIQTRQHAHKGIARAVRAIEKSREAWEELYETAKEVKKNENE